MTATRLVTVAELAEMSDEAGNFELIEGELIPVPPPKGEHAEVLANIIALLHNFVAKRRLGRVFGDAGYVLERGPDSVIGPDVSYISADRLPQDRSVYFVDAPDLAVEIVSPSNSPGDIERKIAIYLRAGSRCVWIAYPRERQVVVHIPGEAPRIYRESDVVPGEPMLPGLEVPVADIFA